MIFFTSDLHFEHKNICLDQGDESYTQRHLVWGNDTHAMTLGLIENYRSVITEDDTVYFLGDVVMGKIAESLPLVSQLPGHKKLNESTSRWKEVNSAL